ncbi:unnamed protein product [Pieris macdunnoughi]|uniref:Uncharacterized protein n=1 Tax=Pieris macdunnoughi TaxID=345717 RepID=A0A821VFR0_9NEOP|nr:unnamed protein product [Pieris macdunnoughi]
MTQRSLWDLASPVMLEITQLYPQGAGHLAVVGGPGPHEPRVRQRLGRVEPDAPRLHHSKGYTTRQGLSTLLELADDAPEKERINMRKEFKL